MSVRVQSQEEIQLAEQKIEQEAERRAEAARAQHASFATAVSAEPADVEALTLPEPIEEQGAQPRMEPVRRFADKIGRNDPCPCGSGKKYNQCHGRSA